MTKPFFIGVQILCLSFAAIAQPPAQKDFLSFQKSFKKVTTAFDAREEVLKQEFEGKGLVWPARYMYLRSFKYDSKLEVWVKSEKSEKYKLFKTYKVCALAGNFGPKRFEGDYQVPEGFYYLNQFKPNSNYHMALGVNYPNPSDRVLSDPVKPGAEIFIHGSCVTVGCIPLTDPIIEELYVLAAITRNAGQDYIPIHVMPVMFKNEKSLEKLTKFVETRTEYKPMVSVFEKVYYYFNQYRNLPTILIGEKGEYLMAQEYTIPKKPVIVKYVPNTEPRRNPAKVSHIPDNEFFPSVYKQPQFPGGLPAFQKFIDGLAEELTPFMPDGLSRAFIEVGFVIDKKGNVVNVSVSDKANNEMNNLILDRFEAMPAWQPALRPDLPVPMKLTQTIMVNGKAPAEVKKSEDDYD
jgi:murein L,D-transpeptidase YafK